MKEHEQTPMLFTIDDASYLLNVSTSSIRRWIKDGSMKTIRLGVGLVRIDRDELIRIINESRNDNETAGASIGTVIPAGTPNRGNE